MVLALLVAIPPLVKVPVLQSEPQLFAAAQVKFIEYALQVRLDRVGGNNQDFRDLIVSIAQTDQCHHLLLAARKRGPSILQFALSKELI